jgi:formate dehydrogenase iron-sulfur subunit
LPSPIGVNENEFTGTYQNPPDINDHTRLIMTYREEDGGHKGVKWAFGRRSCQHCSSAPCESVCPTGALYIHESGLVGTDPSKCIACHYCSAACPFDVPRYDGIQGKINKCNGCVDRVDHGLAPACVKTCQPEALMFGPRDEMIAEAEKRLTKLREHGYEDAVIYGVNEMNGLHVIHVLKHGVAAHDQVENPQISPITELTHLMKPITGVMAGATVLGLGAMFGLAAGYKRDKVLYNTETGDTISSTTGEVVKHGDGEDTMSVKEHLVENLPSKKGGSHE